MSQSTSESREVAQQGPSGISVPTNSLLNFLAAAARDPSVDIAKFEALLRMQREIIADEAKNDFNEALAVVQAEMEPVVRDTDNKQTKSRYAKLETIDAAIRPIYTKHGFSLTFDTLRHDGPEIRMTCDVSRGRHSRTYHLDAMPDMAGAQGVVNKTQMHGVASAVTYLRRYLTTMIFNVVLTNEDDDGNVGGGRRNSGVIDNIVDAAINLNRQQQPNNAQQEKRAATWIDGAKAALDAESDGWKWMQVLLTALREVPSFGDLVALDALDPVVNARKTAPDPVKAKIDDAFAAARARLNQTPLKDLPEQQDGKPAEAAAVDKPAEVKPATPTPKQEDQQPPFGEVAFDASGERVMNEDGIELEFTRARDFALWYRGAWVASKGNIALAEHNADALACALLDPAAKVILDAIELPEEGQKKAEQKAEGQPPAQDSPVTRQRVVLPRLQGGGPDWVTYDAALAKDLETITTVAAMEDWIALNEVVFRSNRESRVKTNYAGRIAPMIDEKMKALQTPAGPPRDHDMERAEDLIRNLDKVTTRAELEQLGASVAVRALVARWTSTRPDIMKILRAANEATEARVKAPPLSGHTGEPANEKGDPESYEKYAGENDNPSDQDDRLH